MQLQFFTVSEKLIIIREAEENGNHAAGGKFDVSESCIRCIDVCTGCCNQPGNKDAASEDGLKGPKHVRHVGSYQDCADRTVNPPVLHTPNV
jgi:hypothetical protein